MIDDAATAEPYCYLTTTGRRTGRAHTIEIWFGAGDGVLYLISGGRDRSDWVRNLLVAPQATVRLGGRTLTVRARLPLPHGPERDDAAEMLHAKYGTQVTSTLDDWRRDAYLVALDVSMPDRA